MTEKDNGVETKFKIFKYECDKDQGLLSPKPSKVGLNGRFSAPRDLWKYQACKCEVISVCKCSG